MSYITLVVYHTNYSSIKNIIRWENTTQSIIIKKNNIQLSLASETNLETYSKKILTLFNGNILDLTYVATLIIIIVLYRTKDY